MAVLTSYLVQTDPEVSSGLIVGLTGFAQALRAAQKFTLSADANVDSAMIQLKNTSGQSEDCVLRVETDNGSPTGTLVDPNATAPITAASIPAAYGWVTATFSGQFKLTAGTTYWLVHRKSSEPGNGTSHRWGGDAAGDPHYNGGGSGNRKPYLSGLGTWVSSDSQSLYFQILGSEIIVGSRASRIQNVGVGAYIRNPKRAGEILKIVTNDGNSYVCYPVTGTSPVTLDTTRYQHIPLDTQVQVVGI